MVQGAPGNGWRTSMPDPTRDTRREIAAMVAAMGGLDALVFTGGVGEHQPAVRAPPPDRNQDVTSDGEIGAGPVRTLVVTAREDVEIARQVRRVVG